MIPFSLNMAQEDMITRAADLLLQKWAAEAGIELKSLIVRSTMTRAVLAVTEAYLEGADQDLADQVADALRAAVPSGDHATS